MVKSPRSRQVYDHRHCSTKGPEAELKFVFSAKNSRVPDAYRVQENQLRMSMKPGGIAG